MINWNFLENNKDELRVKYLTNRPFPHLIIDDFCEESKLINLRDSVPELSNKSRDYMFAGNKFEKSNYKELGPLFEEYYNDIKSDRFNSFLSFISSKEVFVDPKNHGGGLHQGKKNSFLDMHLDFNYHPLQHKWYRQMNLLLYLNKEWKQEYGGHLKIKDLRSGEKAKLDVPFNRLIIQECGPYSLHGYDMTSFPEGNYRTSIATYAYTKHNVLMEKPRTTDWFPNNNASSTKRFIAKHYDKAVKIKNKFFGSGTAKNQ